MSKRLVRPLRRELRAGVALASMRKGVTREKRGRTGHIHIRLLTTSRVRSRLSLNLRCPGARRFQSGQAPQEEAPRDKPKEADAEFSFAEEGSMEKVFTAALKELRQNAKVTPTVSPIHDSPRPAVLCSA